jgi:hypothetical protein
VTTVGFTQQQAISDRRRAQKRISGWAQFTCPNVKCACNEVNIFVEEGMDIKPFQAPNRCPRCGDALIWEGWGTE